MQFSFSSEQSWSELPLNLKLSFIFSHHQNLIRNWQFQLIYHKFNDIQLRLILYFLLFSFFFVLFRVKQVNQNQGIFLLQNATDLPTTPDGNESLQLCMEATKFGALSINKTSRQYKKPPRTIHNKLSNIHTKSVGRPVLYKLTKFHHQTVFTSQVIQ